MVATVERAQARSSGGIAVTPGRGVVDALVGYAACAPGGGPGSIVVLMLTPPVDAAHPPTQVGSGPW